MSGGASAERQAGDKGERIAKRIARSGFCSRRDAERLIAEGRVKLNGRVLASPAVTVGTADRIEIDGEPLATSERTRLFLFNKPKGLVTTNRDPQGRPTVFSALPPELPRVVTIGRLDINTEGLLLLTNDGGLARVLELPATGWLRRYRVRAHGKIDQPTLDKLRRGVTIDGMVYGAVEAKIDRVQGTNLWLTVGLREGKNREVKRVLEHLGLGVNRLIRVSYGPFQLGDLKPREVEEVRGRVLRDQLGEKLASAAGADFAAPIRQPQREPEPKATARKPRSREAPPAKRKFACASSAENLGAERSRRRARTTSVRRATGCASRSSTFSSIPTIFRSADTRVLDLFAGTGALGIEALSRGAAQALFVETGVEGRGLIRKNMETFGLNGVARILRRDATDLGAAGTIAPFDLVFLDPPYGKGLGENALASAAAGGWLKPGALCVLEELAAAAIETPPGFEFLDKRKSGDTQLIFLRRVSVGLPDAPARSDLRGGCQTRPDAKHRKLLLHASKLRRSRLDCEGLEFVANARRLVDVLADENLVGVGKVLHTRSDVHGLPEIIQPIIQGDGDRRALVHADLQDQFLVGLPLD